MGWLQNFLRGNVRKEEYNFDFTTAKRNCRVLVIDDDKQAVPIEELRKSGYFIEQITEVDAGSMHRCEGGEFDIILLDYKGVAPQNISPDDGFGVFERLRSANPLQYVVAISGQTYDISKTEYLSKANDWLKKPIDLVRAKEKLDRGIRERFDKNNVFRELRSALVRGGYPADKIDSVLTAVNGRKFESLDRLIEFMEKGLKVAKLSTELATAAKLLWKIL